MSLPMVSAVTVDTMKRQNPGSGILLNNFDYSSATDAYTLMALVRAAIPTEKCFGPTRGGLNITEGRETWSPTYDSKRMRYKGDSYFAGAAPKVSGSLVSFTPEAVRSISGAANIDNSNPLAVKVQPRATIEENDYFQNVVFVSNNGPDGLYLVELKNALCTVGQNMQTVDKDTASMPFEFMAHSDSPEFTDDLPISCWFFSAAAEAAADENQESNAGETAEE